MRTPPKSVGNVANVVLDAVTEQKLIELKKLVEWLCPEDVIQETSDCTENTGKWIIDHETYVNWACEIGSVLWLQGESKGPWFRSLIRQSWCRKDIRHVTFQRPHKLIYRSQVEQHLRNSHPTAGVAAFYCDSTFPKSDPRTIFGSLLKQLISSTLVRNDDALKIILNTYSRHRDDYYRTSLSKKKMHQLSMEFVSVLQQVSVFLPQVYLIIDGIDECGENRREVLMALDSLLDSQTINLFVASRPETDIERALSGQPTIKMEKEYVLVDIATHLDWVLDYEQFDCPLDDSLKNEIKTILLTKSEGRYKFLTSKPDLTLIVVFNGCNVNSLASEKNPMQKKSSVSSKTCLADFGRLTSVSLTASKAIGSGSTSCCELSGGWYFVKDPYILPNSLARSLSILRTNASTIENWYRERHF